jgi:hypothetical protein
MTARDSEYPAGMGPGNGGNNGGDPGLVGPRSGKPRLGGSGPDRIAERVVGYPISGMVVYGAVGALIGHFTHLTMAFPVGLLVGLLLGIALMFYRLHTQDDVGGDRIDR